MSATHYLKTWPAYFEAVDRGDKNFEVRKNDRAFQTGDTLVLEYYDPDCPSRNPGMHAIRKITFVLPGGQFGIEAGYVVMGLANVPEGD